MFAFAIWDSGRERLFAARDRFGEKPFYYAIGPDYLVFASEMKALFASGLVAAEPNPRAIYRYLALREVDAGEETPFLGVRSLLPAHSLSYSRRDRRLATARYWDLDPDAHLVLGTDAAYAERFLDLLTDSVRIRLRSDVPVGSSLSGGLDSSSVVCLMKRELRGGNQKTFSARFHDPRLDEGKHIAQVVAWTGVAGREVFPDPHVLPDEMERIVWHQEEPFFSTSIFAQWCVMRLAREEGVTVLLDGQGGDETLAGYHTYFGPHFRDLLLRLRWKTLAGQAASYLRDHGPREIPVILFTMLPERLRQPVRRCFRPLGLHPESARAWKDERERATTHFRRGLDDAQYQTLTRTMLPPLLRYADRNSMAFSREVRLPFLDHRLVEFLFSIPPEQRLRGTTTKAVLRTATRGLIPEEIRTRKDKLGFEAPEAEWMRGPLRPWIHEILNSKEFGSHGWLDQRATLKTWESFLAGDTRAHSLIWRWVTLEMWARAFLDRG
jgi:asparagine synthase (glutamine-hydrolysing)